MDQFLNSLPAAEQQQLALCSDVARDDAAGETPGSDRGDEEKQLYLNSLPDGESRFLESCKGLGNSQKAEVAWLDRMGYTYEELDVRAFSSAT
jgi:hypothetical protein